MGQGQRASAAALAPSCWRKWRACASSLRRGKQQSRGKETVPCGVLRSHLSVSTVRGMTATEWWPSACALECLLTQGPCLPRILGGEPQANHHPRRQEEDSQPRGGQVIVARQGKGGEEGEVVCEDEQPRAGAELDERLHLAGLRHGSENSSRTARRLHTASTAREPCCRRAEAPAAPLRQRSARGEAASPCCSLRGRRSSTLRQATYPLHRRRSPPACATDLQETEGVRVRRKPSTRA